MPGERMAPTMYGSCIMDALRVEPRVTPLYKNKLTRGIGEMRLAIRGVMGMTL